MLFFLAVLVLYLLIAADYERRLREERDAEERDYLARQLDLRFQLWKRHMTKPPRK